MPCKHIYNHGTGTTLREVRDLILYGAEFAAAVISREPWNGRKTRSGNTYPQPAARAASERPSPSTPGRVRLTSFRRSTSPASEPTTWKARKPMPDFTRIRKGRINKHWPLDLKHTVPLGFVNRGPYCYRLAMLQALLHLPVFYNFLGTMHYNCETEGPDECIVCALQDLAQAYWLTRNEYCGRDKLKSADRDRFPNDHVGNLEEAFRQEILADRSFYEFTVPSPSKKNFKRDACPQGDPVEFFEVLIEKLREKENPYIKKKYGTSRLERLVMTESVEIGQCIECGQVAEPKVDSVDRLAVSVTSRRGGRVVGSLMDGLREYHTSEMEVACEDCQSFGAKSEGQNSKRESQRKITQAADLLCVQLKRYNNEGRKLRDDVPFLEKLDLSEFAAEETKLTYRLHAVVGHAGNLGGGHYVCGVRTRAPGKDDKSWTVLNDNDVGKPLTFEGMKSHLDENFQPYVLLYQKLD